MPVHEGRYGRRDGKPAARNYDPPMPTPTMLAAHNARVLDPSSATVVPGLQMPRSTVYVADRLLVPAHRSLVDVTAEVRRVAEPLGLEVVEQDGDVHRFHLPEQVRGEQREYGVTRLQLVPRSGSAVAAPDAWDVLQAARAGGRAEGVMSGVSLDHLLFASPGIVGSPYHESNPYHDSNPFHETNGLGEWAAIAGYGLQGSGGRQPVAWLGPPPHRRKPKGRRPVVVVLDTGCGRHRWLDEVVQCDGRLGDTRIGMDSPETDPEVTGDLTGPLDGAIDAVSGHGTFIAGLVHQGCPDADIVALRIVHSDGVIIESDLIDALTKIADVVHRYADGDDGACPVDVLNLSMGYYHETPVDHLFDPTMYGLLRSVGLCGTVVVAAAGNDATTREMFPAAFAPYADGYVSSTEPDCVPVLSVGAENPDRSVALFSNCGDWVSCWAPGAALVSTMPETFNGGFQPTAMTYAVGRERESLDPDDFRQGFGVWSGTSFAAPVVAGALAAELLARSESGEGPLSDRARATATARAWKAVEKVAGLAPS